MKHHWQKQRQQADHIDDWLMTYADVITLLLCFFAVFLSFSMVRKDVPHDAPNAKPVQHYVEPPPPPVQEKPKEPDILEGNLPFHGLERVEKPSDKSAETIDDLNKLAETPLDVKNADGVKPPASLPEIVDRLKVQGAATIEQKGDRITTLDVNSAAFFDSGSATLSDAGKAALRDVAVNIKSDQFRDYQVTVEGHTDDSPIKTAFFPSNWELSTARASAVVHFFLDQGVPAQRLRAAGYADTFPKVPNRDDAGKPLPGNQAKNRRVVIKLEKIEKTDERKGH
jgi:chemotaxis protein MotB